MPINKKIIAGASVLALAVGAGLMVRAAGTFTPEAQPIGYVGQPAVSSVDVSKGTALLYAISYSARDWSGDLHAYPVSPNGTVGTVDTWGDGASSKVKAQSKADARLIVTIKNGAGIPFQWNDLSTGAGGQRQQLDPAAAAASATSSLVLDYIRGSDANEGTAAGKFRPRNYGLGDMIHSTPVFWNDGVNKTIFVGANDGMLHAFNAADGSERFAYVPAVLLPKLGALTNQAYSHNYYVDGRLDVKKFETKTILAGTLGGGGKAVFALNVSTTAPTDEANAAAKVLWEISNQHPDYAELGNTYGAPVLTTLPDGRDALVIGNGYNNDGNGHAVLYVINAHTGALIKAFDTGSGSEASPNGLSSPSLWDSDGDKIKDTVYAGDVDGNLWKFSLASGFATPVRKLHTNTLGAAQAITMAPGLLHHPLGGVMVNFVTGRMLEKSDAANAVAHYAYGIWDGAPSQNAQLLEQELKEENYLGVTDHTIRVRRATSNQPNWTAGAGNHRGWRTVLPINGERVVGDGAFVTGEVFQFFATNPTINPDVLPSGENWWMQLNALT
ncbi:MAG: pilus assembly protein, partial [Telluria sp.]